MPNARRSEVVGEYGEAIKVKVQANEALRDLSGRALAQIPARNLEIVAGEKSRDKTVAVMDLGMEEVRMRLLATWKTAFRSLR